MLRLMKEKGYIPKSCYLGAIFSAMAFTLCCLFWAPEIKALFLMPGPKSIATVTDEKLGRFNIVQQCDGLISGWSVSMMHETPEGLCVGFYLAHEVDRWIDSRIYIQGNFATIANNGSVVAVYDVGTGEMSHKLSGVQYSRTQGINYGKYLKHKLLAVQ
jgi:hypothetical protein